MHGVAHENLSRLILYCTEFYPGTVLHNTVLHVVYQLCFTERRASVVCQLNEQFAQSMTSVHSVIHFVQFHPSNRFVRSELVLASMNGVQ